MDKPEGSVAYRTEDGVPFKKGDWVFDYYDMVGPIQVGEIDSGGWFNTLRENNSRGPLLNGQRICSLEFATKKGWIK